MVRVHRNNRSITDQGFQFLLKDNYRQLWTFLSEYIRDAEQRSGAPGASSCARFVGRR